MDGTLAFYAGSPGSITAVGKSKKLQQYSDGFSPSRHQVVG